MGLKQIVNNLAKPIEVAPDGFLIAAGTVATKYLFDVDLPNFAESFLYGVAAMQYAKGIRAYLKTSKHIKEHGDLDERFVSKMHNVICYRLGMRCATRNHDMLDAYKDITSTL
jgi:hypothetical protein